MLLFQQVELLLKALLNNCRFEAAGNDPASLVVKPTANLNKRMLGQLIEPLVEFHLKPFDPAAQQPKDDNLFSFSFAFTCEFPEVERVKFKQELESLVSERNDFIHHLLTNIRLDSVEGCQKASENLQQLYKKIAPTRDKLKRLFTVLVEGRTELRNLLEQDHIWQEIVKNHTEAKTAPSA